MNAVDSSSGLPVLSIAVTNGHTECLDILIESGANVDAQVKGTGNTALHEAVEKGPSRLPCIQTLLRYENLCLLLYMHACNIFHNFLVSLHVFNFAAMVQALG